MLTRETFLGLKGKRRIEPRTVCGHQLYIRSLTEKEWSEYEAAPWRKAADGKMEVDDAEMELQRLRLVAAAVCDEQGNPLLTPADLAELRDVDGGLISAIAVEVRHHCGFDYQGSWEKNS